MTTDDLDHCVAYARSPDLRERSLALGLQAVSARVRRARLAACGR